jgi:transcription elongation factor GreA
MAASKIKKNYLTKEWYEKLAQELHDLKVSKLPNILERLWEAKALWDLSENFEYKTALEDKDFLESRVSEIEWLIKNVEILESETNNKKWKWVIDFNSVVSLKIDWEKHNITIVWTWEIDMEIQDDFKISFESPIWSAIRWRQKWDVVKVRLPSWRKELEILDVK